MGPGWDVDERPDCNSRDSIYDSGNVQAAKNEVFPEKIAKAFHETYERLAPVHDYNTRKASAVPWEKVPKNNRELMQAVVVELLKQGVILPGHRIFERR